MSPEYYAENRLFGGFMQTEFVFQFSGQGANVVRDMMCHCCIVRYYYLYICIFGWPCWQFVFG